MKKFILCFVLPIGALVACKQNASDVAITSLTASSTNVAVGETVTVSVSSNANAVSWSVTPPTAAKQTYSVTTEKSNYFTFSHAGDYVVGVRTGHLQLDSLHHCDHSDSLHHHVPDSLWNHSIDSIWHHHGHHLGNCQNGRDSASVQIHVH
jgi:hypothetical protein